MFVVKNNNIVMTKGDSGMFNIKLYNADGSEYTPDFSDKVVFSVKKRHRMERYSPIVMEKEGTRILLLKEDTENVDSGNYVYDVVIEKLNGERLTVIEGTMEIRKAVHKFD